MTPLTHPSRGGQLRADIAHPGPGRYRLLRTQKWPHRWLVVPDVDAATGGPQTGVPQIGGR
jgi:hypothetical protein